MKTINLFLLLMVAMLAACSANKKSRMTASDQEWPEMDEFHMAMAESFHPYMDSGNLQPAKINAAKLSELAEKWQNAPLPSKVNNESIKQYLKELTENTKVFAAQINSGNDKETGGLLNTMHEIFHKIQDAWYKAEH